jgi:hypothetical protein
MKKLIILIGFLRFMSPAFSQNVQVTAQAPNVVETGEQFQIDFIVNAEPSNIVVPEIHDFKILYGPSTSQSSNIQIINGKTSQSVQYTYSYVLQSSKAGKYLIGSAEVTVNGKKYKSNNVTIEVVGSGTAKSTSPSQQSTPGTQGSASGQSQAQPQQVSADGNVFIRVLTDRKSVHQGEYITASVKIYSKQSISSIDNVEFPTFENFFKQDIETKPLRSLERENVNGEIYYTGVIKKFILIPQKSGNLVINPMTMDCSVQQRVQQSRSRGIFDDFFGPTVQNIPMKLKSKPVTITVSPLPGNAPPTFNGAVGRFTFDAKVNKTEVKTNDAITLKVSITGNGNIKLIDPPKVQFPPDFDSYDPKITVSTSDANGGISGSKTFEYLLIPRNPGDFTIAPLTFSYFDVASNQYKTLKSNEFNFKVEKGAGGQSSNVVSGLSKEDVKFFGKDILYIKTNHFNLSKINNYFFGSGLFYLIYIAGLIAFGLIIWFRRRIITQNANIAYVKNRRADKFATKRLKQAKIHLTANEQEKFYDELLKAIWGYLSDKLNIALSDLSRDTALEMLRNRGVDEETLLSFIQLVDNGEFARYAPSSAGISIQEDYNKAIDLISKFQNKLK